MLEKSMWIEKFLDGVVAEEYFKLCSKHTDEPKYFERHHILPKSIFPQYDKEKWNIVRLSYRDHYIAHEMLVNMCIDPKAYRAMCGAIHLMSKVNTTADEYAYNKQRYIDTRTGSTVPQETRDKIAKTMIGISKTPEQIAKYIASATGKKRSDEAKKNMSESQKKRVWDKSMYEKQGNTRRKYSYEAYDTLGNLVKTYPTNKDFMADGFSDSAVTNVCKGRKIKHGGLIWKQIPRIV